MTGASALWGCPAVVFPHRVCGVCWLFLCPASPAPPSCHDLFGSPRFVSAVVCSETTYVLVHMCSSGLLSRVCPTLQAMSRQASTLLYTPASVSSKTRPRPGRPRGRPCLASLGLLRGTMTNRNVGRRYDLLLGAPLKGKNGKS